MNYILFYDWVDLLQYPNINLDRLISILHFDLIDLSDFIPTIKNIVLSKDRDKIINLVGKIYNNIKFIDFQKARDYVCMVDIHVGDIYKLGDIKVKAIKINNSSIELYLEKYKVDDIVYYNCNFSIDIYDFIRWSDCAAR